MKLSKIHGLGNDFVITDYIEGLDYPNLAIKLCDRHTGIGADGLIFVKKEPMLEMVYYNADGSRAPMCGNGIRCFSLYCYKNGIINSKTFDVNTLAGIMKLDITSISPFKVRVNMGKPKYDNSLLGLDEDVELLNRKTNVNGFEFIEHSVFMGTVHTIVFVDSFEDEILHVAKEIHEDRLFKNKTNVNFVKVVNENKIMVKTYERGCGWTLACGTGCTASVVIANKLGLTKEKVDVELEKGILTIEVKDDIYMDGPAEMTFQTEIEI